MVETRNDISGVISESNGYNKRKNWKIVGKEGSHIRLSFAVFSFEFHLDCAYDYLEVSIVHFLWMITEAFARCSPLQACIQSNQTLFPSV